MGIDDRPSWPFIAGAVCALVAAVSLVLGAVGAIAWGIVQVLS